MTDRFNTKWLYIVVLLSFFSTLYILEKLFNLEEGLDFRLIWLSGQVWLNGGNPYESEFITMYHAVFGDGPVSHFWVYPPNWSIITVPLSLLSFKSALFVWHTINYLMLPASSYLIVSAVYNDKNRVRILLMLLTYSFIATLQSTAVTVSLGQTSIISCFAISLVIWALRFSSNMALTIGLFLSFLKPNIGMMVLVYVIFMNRMLWRQILWSVCLSIAAALPAFIINDTKSVIVGFINNLSIYSSSDFLANTPQNLTGISQLANYFLNSSIPTLFLVFFGMLATALISKYIKSNTQILFILSIVVFIPLHTYDFVLLAILIPLFLSEIKMSSVISIVLLILCWRVSNLANLLEVTNINGSMFPGSLLISLFTFIMFFVNLIPSNTYITSQLKKTTNKSI